MLAFGLAKIPLIFIVQPRIVKVNKHEGEVIIPLNYITKNHLGAMYFGGLSIGADLAGGVMALDAIARSKRNVVFVFKDFKANFLKRAESDVHFICKDGEAINKCVAEAVKTGKRCETTFHITATTPKKLKEPVAEFDLTISLKVK